MKAAVCWSLYDSASSRTHPLQAGAALKSMSRGFFDSLASASASSASFFQFTNIILSSLSYCFREGSQNTEPGAVASAFKHRNLDHPAPPQIIHVGSLTICNLTDYAHPFHRRCNNMLKVLQKPFMQMEWALAACTAFYFKCFILMAS
jgi:hypothetical protein